MTAPADHPAVLRFVASDPAWAAVAARQHALLHDAANHRATRCPERTVRRRRRRIPLLAGRRRCVEVVTG